MTVFSVIISTLSAKDQLKDLAVEVIWPEGPTNRIKTPDVFEGNLNSILFIDDHCPNGMNCIEESMIRAVDKVLSMLFTWAGKTGDIRYESIKKSEIKHRTLQLKVDDNLYRDEEHNEDLSDKIKIKNNKESKKYNNTTEMEITNLNSTENFNAAIESDEEIEQDSEEKDSTTNSVEYIVFGGNKIVPVD